MSSCKPRIVGDENIKVICTELYIYLQIVNIENGMVVVKIPPARCALI